MTMSLSLLATDRRVGLVTPDAKSFVVHTGYRAVPSWSRARCTSSPNLTSGEVHIKVLCVDDARMDVEASRFGFTDDARMDVEDDAPRFTDGCGGDGDVDAGGGVQHPPVFGVPYLYFLGSGSLVTCSCSARKAPPVQQGPTTTTRFYIWRDEFFSYPVFLLILHRSSSSTRRIESLPLLFTDTPE